MTNTHSECMINTQRGQPVNFSPEIELRKSEGNLLGTRMGTRMGKVIKAIKSFMAQRGFNIGEHGFATNPALLC